MRCSGTESKVVVLTPTEAGENLTPGFWGDCVSKFGLYASYQKPFGDAQVQNLSGWPRLTLQGLDIRLRDYYKQPYAAKVLEQFRRPYPTNGTR